MTIVVVESMTTVVVVLTRYMRTTNTLDQYKIPIITEYNTSVNLFTHTTREERRKEKSLELQQQLVSELVMAAL